MDMHNHAHDEKVYPGLFNMRLSYRTTSMRFSVSYMYMRTINVSA